MNPFERAVTEYMQKPVVTVSVEDLVSDAEQKLRENDISSVAVVGRDRTLAGVLSYRDLLQMGHVMGRYVGARTSLSLPIIEVGDVMTTSVVTVGPSDTVATAARKMVDHRIHRLFVVDGSALVGVISTRDVMLAVVDARVRTPIGDVMTSPVHTVRSDETLARAVDRLAAAGVSGLVVLEDGAPGGIFTEVEAVASRDMSPATRVGEVVEYQLVCLPPNTPLYRAAAFTVNTLARRVLVLDGGEVAGIVTALDFARAATAEPGTR